jgi:Ribonuclease G/E
MAQYKYAVLEAVPDSRKGERVNIGIIVFLPDRVDVRFRAAMPKLRALAGRGWEPDLEAIRRRWEHAPLSEPYDEAISVFHSEEWLRLSDSAPIFAGSEQEYEQRVQEILSRLVDVPKTPRRAKGTRIKTEITRELKNTELLASPEEGLDSRKVVKDFAIAPQEELYADFAVQNGVLHCISTLDLRKETTKIDEAALKAIVLDKAAKEREAKTIGIIAMDPELGDIFQPHVDLLRDYARYGLYNWLVPADRVAFLHTIGDVVRRHDPFSN